jgi:hypothetical protein
MSTPKEDPKATEQPPAEAPPRLPVLMDEFEVASWLGIRSRQVGRMVRLNEIPHLVLPTGEVRFDPAELAMWLDQVRERQPEIRARHVKRKKQPPGEDAGDE